MKNLLVVFIIIFMVNGCTKEHQSPEEQLVEVIQAKFKKVPDNTTFYVLKSNTLCNKLDCRNNEFSKLGSSVKIYTKEEIFMRGLYMSFEVVAWEESPKIIVRGRRGQPTEIDPVTGKCRGN